jgi:hypothetical protein
VEFLKERRKEILLGAILIALAAVLWQQIGGDPAGMLSGGRGGAGGRTDLSTIRIFPVEWAALTAPRPAYDPLGRNIFQFGEIPPPPPPVLTPEEQAAIKKAQLEAEEERKRQEELMRKQQAEALAKQQEVANLPPPPPPKPQPPPVNYKFIGYVGPSERKIAVLHDGTDMIFARQGDVVGKEFRILEIGYESIKFGFTDPRFKQESQTLPMSSSY